MTRGRFGSLDGLRALSILSVVVFHASRGGLGAWSAQLAVGVSVFFAVSGFLITTLVLRERDRTGEVDLRAFYARRALRIFPLYYGVLALYVCIVYAVERDPYRSEFFAHLPAYATYTSDWFVRFDPGRRVVFYFAWSLATEEQFYLVWPSVERRLPGHLAPGLLAVALALVQPAVVWAGLDGGALVYRVLASVAPPVCLGVALAHLLHASERARRTFATPWLSPACAALLVATLARFDHASLVVAVVVTLLVGSCVASESHALARALAWRPIASIGQVSYGIYLLHMLASNAVERAAPHLPLAAKLPAVVALSWGAAWVSFNTYEKWFMDRKARFQVAPVRADVGSETFLPSLKNEVR